MSIYTRLAHRLESQDYELVVKEITRWSKKQDKDFSQSRYVIDNPGEAYAQALMHLRHALTDKEEVI